MDNIEKRYQALLASLSERFPSVQKCGFTPDSFKPGLEGMQRLDRALGQPWKEFTCIHVAGTNGKGSVSSMLAAALHKAGFRTGLYTSPHLVDFRERMRIIGEGTPSKAEVASFIEAHDMELDGLSFFDITTGMAFRWFADGGVDIAVIETGLGGRLDSTNVINPVLSIVTSIGLDHCGILGDTRAKIASEKAGIFKKGSAALVWGRDNETGPVFDSCAASAGSTLQFASDKPAYPFEKELLGSMDLKGPCQEINLHTVLCALEMMGYPFSREILDGIVNAAALSHLRGRWERLRAKPEVICDIGHNPEALKMNFSRLSSSGKPQIIVYGVMADKDWKTNISLIPQGSVLIVTAPDTPRALPADELFKEVRNDRPELEAYCCSSVREAVGKALGMADENSIVYIGGSTFVVAEAINLF